MQLRNAIGPSDIVPKVGGKKFFGSYRRNLVGSPLGGDYLGSILERLLPGEHRRTSYHLAHYGSIDRMITEAGHPMYGPPRTITSG